MGKAELFKKLMELKFGSSWQHDIGLKAKYERLVREDKERELIRESAKTIEESFQRGEKAEIRAKLLKGLSDLALGIIEDSSMRKAIFERHNQMLKELEKVITTFEQTYKQKIETFEETKVLLFTELKNQIADSRKLQYEAREATDKANAQTEELNTEILAYNKLRAKLNEEYAKFNNRVKKFNKNVRDLNVRQR